ncbi:MAG: hypothetical protein GQ475_05280, partial [Methylococcaceae bacterium]|nr:hypothetical protein [Methylococcaceae bacterium]
DVQLGTGNITLKNLSDSTEQVIDVTNHLDQLLITGSTLTIDLSSDMASSKDYAVRVDETAIKDAAGNNFSGIADDTTWNFSTLAEPTVNTSIVIFDLVGGASSAHSSRVFAPDIDYQIFIKVYSDSEGVSTNPIFQGASWGKWEGAGNLGAGDSITLVSDSKIVGVQGNSGLTQVKTEKFTVNWRTSLDKAAFITVGGEFIRSASFSHSRVAIYAGSLSQLGQVEWLFSENVDLLSGGIMTSQGLASAGFGSA